MPRSRARRLLALALAVGFAAELLLDGSALGVNVLILVSGVLAAGWWVRRPARIDPIDAWLPVAAVVMAAFVAVRADPVTIALDVAASLVLVAASFIAFDGIAVSRGAATAVGRATGLTLGSVVVGSGRVVAAARPVGPTPRPSARLAAVARGLVVGVPLAIVFVGLFASADPVFGSGVERVTSLRLDLDELGPRILFVIVVAWLVGGLLSVVALDGARWGWRAAPDAGQPTDASGPPAPREPSAPGARADGDTGAEAAASAPTHAWGVSPATPWRPWRLGGVEAVVILSLLVVLFALFVGIQLGYLFGGLDSMAAAGVTYSDYARRGYLELVVAALLVVAVLAGLESVVVGRSTLRLTLSLVLIALTGLVLVSAAQRLGLYQAAYGWTELRLWVAISMVALAGLLLSLAWMVAARRIDRLGHVMAGLIIASIFALNVIVPPAFVAARNLERAIDPSVVPADGRIGLDATYLAGLSDDAVPTLVAGLPHLPADDRALVRAFLLVRRQTLAHDPSIGGPGALNLARQAAIEALDALEPTP